jgi:hypothetical protein
MYLRKSFALRRHEARTQHVGVPHEPGKRASAHTHSSRGRISFSQSGAKRLTKRYATGLGMLACVLLICSCGASNSAGPTRAQFVSRANAVCAAALTSAGRLNTPKSAAELLHFSERASSIVSKVVSELKGVMAPPDLRVAYNTFLTASAHELRMLGELVQALRAGNAARAHTTLQAFSSNTVNEQAKALGITECARTVTPG